MKYAKCYIKKYENCQLILVVVLFSRKLVNFLGKKYFFFSLNVLKCNLKLVFLLLLAFLKKQMSVVFGLDVLFFRKYVLCYILF